MTANFWGDFCVLSPNFAKSPLLWCVFISRYPGCMVKDSKPSKKKFVHHRLPKLAHTLFLRYSCSTCTTTEFKIRFRNQISSMKTNKKTCEVAACTHLSRRLHILLYLTFQCTKQIQTIHNKMPKLV